MILTLLLVLLIVVCLALGVVVLLQQSEGGALGMGGGPSGFMTARGAGDLLTRTTWVLGGLVFALCLALTILQGKLHGGGSVVDRLKIDPLDAPSAPRLPVAPAAPASAGGATGFEAPRPQVNGIPSGGFGSTSTTTPAVPAARGATAAPPPAPAPAVHATVSATPPARGQALPAAGHQHRPGGPRVQPVRRRARQRRHARAQGRGDQHLGRLIHSFRPPASPRRVTARPDLA